MKTKIKPAVRVTARGETFYITRLVEDRHKTHGFGTFFWNAKPEDIEFDDKAWELLRRCVGRKYSSIGDLFGMDISWVAHGRTGKDGYPAGMLFNYGFAGKKLTVPAVDATIDLKSYDILAAARKAE